MRVVFDFDGTITAHPQAMYELATALHKSGHEIVILTAAAGELPPEQRPAEVARRISRCGFNVPHLLVCIEGCRKGDWCLKNEVDMVIDDELGYLETIKVMSPTTIRLHVQR